MSEDEMEKFEITDYDLDNEFNMFRHRKGLSKQQQIYGIWADDSDNDDDENGRSSFNKPKKQKSYSAPIGFVSGGTQQAGRKHTENESSTQNEIKKEDNPTTSFKSRDSSDESGDEIPLRAGFGAGKKLTTEHAEDIAGLRSRNKPNTSLMNQGVGNWEKHTKGIGAKLLLQMGYQPGKGLGKDLQGISAPVEAHLRKGRGAIGAYGPEKAASIAKKKDLDIKVEKESHEDNKESKWKKDGGSVKNKTRYYYRSVDDVIEKGKRPGGFKNSGVLSALTKVKVIDMTGPQQRVLSGYHALSGLKAPPGVEHFEDVVHKKCSNFALPEIQHNLDLLVDMCEQEIIRVDRNTRHNQDKIASLAQEEISVMNQLKKENELVSNLKQVMDVVNKLMNPLQEYSLGQIGTIFINLQKTHFEEYCKYELGELAPGLVGPLLTSALANWNPLAQPKQYMEFFSQWKEILETPKQRGTLEVHGNQEIVIR